jgi:Uma2 family endonuclease
MAAQAQISIEEYLHTSYRPDREYVDGEIRERNVGKWEHARLQLALGGWFWNHEAEWRVMGSTEQRTRVAQLRVRIPDLVLVNIESQPDVLVDPPVLIVEILSPDDTYSNMRERVADYQEMGVKSIWIIDPQTRTGQMCAGDTWTTARVLTVPDTRIHVDLDELFSYFGRPAQGA